MIPSPCKRDCTRRGAHCCITCPEWAEYEKARNEDYEKRKSIADGGSYRADKHNRMLRRQYRGKRR